MLREIAGSNSYAVLIKIPYFSSCMSLKATRVVSTTIVAKMFHEGGEDNEAQVLRRPDPKPGGFFLYHPHFLFGPKTFELNPSYNRNQYSDPETPPPATPPHLSPYHTVDLLSRPQVAKPQRQPRAFFIVLQAICIYCSFCNIQLLILLRVHL